MRTFFCLLVLQFSSLFSIANNIIITEIHYAPEDANLEFVELYNNGIETVDLSNWQLSKGISYTFPKGIQLQAKQYLVVAKSPYLLVKNFHLADSVQVVGSFDGRLTGDGESLLLSDHSKQEIDRVNYKNNYTWPICHITQKTSLQLVNPNYDNRIGNHWAVASPSPCYANKKVHTTQQIPIIKSVRQHPEIPKSNELVSIRANVRNATAIELHYQVVLPGKYIALADSAYAKNWKIIPMSIDKNQISDEPESRVYVAILPNKIQAHRSLIRYKIVAKGDTSSIAPHPSDNQPNFAYYVYDNLPDYKGYSFDQLTPLPICQLIAHQDAVQELVYNHQKRTYPATGTLVYNGQVYDHIGYRSRGFLNRHSRTKRNLKFNFHSNHKIEVLADNGKAYDVKRSKLALSGGWLLDNPNTHGLSESVLYRLFTLQGTSASYADYLHLRVVVDSNETDSVHGDFWGLYLMLENYDGDFLKTHDLADANIYSYKPFKARHTTDKNNAAQDLAYVQWDTSYNKTHAIEWWKKELDWNNYLGFLIGNELIGNTETGYRKQHWWTEYQHPKRGWQFFPWDVDKTWSTVRVKSTISHGIYSKAFEHSELEKEYKNELRSVLDLLYNEEQAFQLIAEEAALIYNPNAAYSFVDLDKLRWGHAYEGSFETQLNTLKNYVQKRRQYILEKLLNDKIPATPQINYTGSPTYKVDSLRFSSQHIDPKSLVSIQWRVAEFQDKNNDYYNKKTEKIYEINSLWSTEDSNLQRTPTIPLGLLQAEHSYRIRVRVKDTTGYYSHWSAPIEFIPTLQPQKTSIYGQDLVINELLFDHETKLEFIELYNNSNKTINLEGFAFVEGVRFQFPANTQLTANAYWVLTNNKKRFKEKYGFEAQGEYNGKLSSKGEQLILVNAYHQLIDSLTYEAYWQQQAEGLSLELAYVDEDNALFSSWKLSTNLFGTPGAINSAFSNVHYWRNWLWALGLMGVVSLGVFGFYNKRSLV